MILPAQEGRWDGDVTATAAATGALGVGIVVALAGTAGGALPLAIVGGGAAAAGLLVLLVAGLLPISVAAAIAVPLPALFEVGDSRVSAAAPVAALCVFAWVIRRCVDRGSVRVGFLPLGTLGVLVASLVLASIAAENFAIAARETLNFLVLVALLVAITDEMAERPEIRTQVIDVLVIVAAACGLLSLIQAVGLIPSEFPRWGTPFYRASLGFGQPNDLGLFLAAVFPLASYRFAVSRGSGRWAAAAAVGFVGIGLVATFSRGSWAAVLAAVAAPALAGQIRPVMRSGWVLAVGALIAEFASGGMLSDTVARTLTDWVVEQRLGLMLAGVSMFQEHPWLGVGPGGFADQVETYAASIGFLWDYQATPHNAYLQMAAEAGVVGVVAFVAFIGTCLVRLTRGARTAASPRVRSLRLALLSSVVAVAVASLGIWPFSHGPGEVVMLLLALAFSFAEDGA